MPQPAPQRFDDAQTRRLLRLHRRALAFRNAQQEADLVTRVDLRWRETLAALCAQPPAPGDARILYNVSSLCRPRFPNSVDRVVLALMTGLAGLPMPFVPVAFDGRQWREARQAPAAEDPRAPRMGATGAPLAQRPGDHFLTVDLDFRLPPDAVAQLARMKAGGLRVTALVHDTFMVTRPEWFALGEILAFDAWLRRTCALADRIVCFSQHVARQLRRWLATEPPAPGAPRRRIGVSVIDAGADGLAEGGPAPQWRAAGAAAGFDLPDDGVPLFLAVAAIHPRKGVDTLLAAFSALWTAGTDARLVLSGREVDEVLAARVRAHPRLGDRLLFPGFLGDAQLRALAARAQAMVLASREEGFGLPMAEAAALGLPVIARDIPVFREIAGDRPFWFGSAGGPQHTLAARLQAWLALPPEQRRRHVPALAANTWARSAAQLAAVMLAGPDFDRLEVAAGPGAAPDAGPSTDAPSADPSLRKSID